MLQRQHRCACACATRRGAFPCELAHGTVRECYSLAHALLCAGVPCINETLRFLACSNAYVLPMIRFKNLSNPPRTAHDTSFSTLRRVALVEKVFRCVDDRNAPNALNSMELHHRVMTP